MASRSLDWRYTTRTCDDRGIERPVRPRGPADRNEKEGRRQQRPGGDRATPCRTGAQPRARCQPWRVDLPVHASGATRTREKSQEHEEGEAGEPLDRVEGQTCQTRKKFPQRRRGRPGTAAASGWRGTGGRLAGVDRHRGLPRSEATRRRAHAPDGAGRSRGRATFSLASGEWRIANGEQHNILRYSLFSVVNRT